jgi:hypothetical protein
MNLADVTQNRSLLDSYQWEQEVLLDCSLCGNPFTKRKGLIIKAVIAGQIGSYCSRRCQGLHVQRRNTIVQGDVAGRICVTCNIWEPLTKFPMGGRSRVCMRCRRQEPEQRFHILRSQAKARDWTWALTYEEFLTFWQQPCSYCGVAIATVGLDRVDSSRGYELKNLIPCCGDCNRGKSDQTEAEFIARCRRVAVRVRGA